MRSAGQRNSLAAQQRVALARALITHPSVLLLDEPLSALDPFLRARMRGELKRLQTELGITFIHVKVFQGVDLVLDCYPKLVAIDEEPDHEIVHGRRFGKSKWCDARAADSGAQIDVFAFDFLRVLLCQLVDATSGSADITPMAAAIR